jgi:hypothetical protein
VEQYFKTLKLKPGAPIEDVKRAYKAQVKIWHPDRFSTESPRLQKRAHEVFQFFLSSPSLIHPMTQGKIERYHRSMKNIVTLKNYYFPWELEQELLRFADYYNNHRYHKYLNKITPTDVYFGQNRKILSKRD